jgi:hypothetical protein
MWRMVFAASILWMLGVPGASACITDAGLRGIVFDRPPAVVPDDALILDVTFADIADDTPVDATLKARVRSVIRGDYRGDFVRIEIPNSSCDRPFLFGTEGLIVGRFQTGFHLVKFNIFHEGRYSTVTTRFGSGATRLVPMSETLQDRYRRGGAVPFAPLDRYEQRDPNAD